MDICNGTQKDDDYQGFPKRDGSLVRKKRLQWEREKANKETWFPFGSPGGGAPNKKFEAVNYELVVEPKLSPEVNVGIDCNPNNNKNQLGSSATSSDSASFRMKLIEKDEERTIMKHVSVNTSTIPQSLKHASSVDRSVDMSNHGLPGVGENRVHPVQCTTAGEHPLFAAFQPINHAYHVPVVFAHFAPHMSADQYNSISDCCNGNFIACPIQFMPKTSNSGLQENSGLNGKLPLDASGGSSSYAEFCSNHLPLWHDGYMGVSSTPKATIKVEDHSNIPSLTNTQPLAVVRPLIPIVSMLPSAASSSSYNFEQHLTCSEDDVAAYTQNSLNSFVSLESLPEQQQSAEFHARDRAKQFEQFCDAQVSEKRKLLAQQAEEKRLENIRVENERKMFDEIEEQRKLEEEKLRSVAETRKLETESALVASLEKARREAALLKKAKLYKHVLEGCEEGTEKSLLGDDDVENDRILYEVECLERQKKINMKVWKEKENLSKLKKEKNGGSSERHLSKVLFNSASDADRPKDTANSVINGVLPCSSAGHTSVDFVRNRIGRQSLRLPTKKIQRMPAADEDLCSNTESKRCVQISKTNTLNDEIQVLSQRRILPTGTKKAFSEKQISFESVNSNDGAASSMPSAMNYSRSFDYEKLSSDIVELGKAAVSELSSNCGADRLQAQSINTTTANGDKAPPVGSVEAKKMKNHRQCSTSVSSTNKFERIHERKVYTKFTVAVPP